MKLKSMLLSAFAMVMTPSGAHATEDQKPYWTSADFGWGIMLGNDNTCNAYGFYNTNIPDDDNFLIVEYDAVKQQVIVSFSHSKTTSLGSYGKINLRIVLIDTEDAHVDDGWGEREFLYTKDELGGPYVFMTRFRSDGPAQILRDIKKARTIAFLNGDTLIRSYNLRGSAVMINKLIECANARAGYNSYDPFVKIK